MSKKKFMVGFYWVTGFVVVLLLVMRLTRSVPPFEPGRHPPAGTWGSLDPETALKLQAILDENVNMLKVPGLQAFVRTATGQTWSGFSGTVDLRRKQPFQRDHVIRTGSVTKTFTAVLVLKLSETGKVNLDEPIIKWFPNLPSAEKITVRHLLDHSSGIPEIIPKVMLKSIFSSTYWEPDELLDLISQDEPAFEPGSQFDYSNSNYILLGLILELESGEPVTQLLHEQILDPLKLKHTFFIPYEPAPDNLVPGYDRDLSKFPGMLDTRVKNTSWATAAFTSGALASTADDLGIFYENLFAGTILNPSSILEMTTFIPASNPGFPEQNGSGLGLMRLIVNGEELIGHVGQFMGSTAIAMFSPAQNDIVVITCNLSNPNLLKTLAEFKAVVK
jgi:D-alanyl-D-alanine carboxypeptidase